MIRLKDFLSLSLNGGVVQLSAAEKALIAYTKWTPGTAEDGTRYIKDEGKSPKYPLVLYSGSGTSFSTNRSITVGAI